MLSDEKITQYQELVKKRFNREISREEALKDGLRLLRLVEITYKPMTDNELKLVRERLKESATNKANKI